LALVDAGTAATIYEGEGEGTLLISGTVVKGDILGYSSGWKRALATVATAIQGRCVAGEAGVSGQRIVVFWDRVVLGGSRFSGATVGGAVYVAEGTDNGEYIQAIPTDSGDCTKIIGYAVSPTVLVITPSYIIDSVKA